MPTLIADRSLRPDVRSSAAKPVNFATEADVVRRLDKLYHKNALKKLELQGSYKTSRKTSRLLDIMDLIEVNYKVTGVTCCRVVIADADFVKSKFPVDYNSLGFYSELTNAIYMYPKPLTPLYTVGLILAHEYAHFLDCKLNITNSIFSEKLTRELTGRGITREALLPSSSAYKNEDMDKEIFATAYHQLFTGTQTDGSEMVLGLAQRCSSLELDLSELKTPGIIERLLFSKNSMMLAA